MRIYPGSKVAKVALLGGGFLLAQTILGCHNRIEFTPVPPQAMAISPKAGDILEWKRPDFPIKSYNVIIPDGLCTPTPAGKHNDDFHVTVVPVEDQGVQCKVLKRAKVAEPVPYYYKYNYETPPGTESQGGKGKKSDAVTLLMIAGSCGGGCDVVQTPDRETDTATASTTPQPALCYKSTAMVTDNYGNDIRKLIVPNTLKDVGWIAQGAPVTLTFDLKSGSGAPLTRPCTNGSISGNTLVVPGSVCNVNDLARTSETTYSYKISMSNCSYPSGPTALILNKK